jgi:pimeloyl-ACP methyl ester carboxylesterase
VEELVPEIERRFPVIASPRGRFVAGHSSGGWAALWLQITHPDHFGGAWATAPDPVDFRSFHGLDVTTGSKANAFRDEHGTPRGLMRADGRDLYSFEDFVRFEDVSGEVLLGTFDWAFSPRGPRGEPLHLIDRATGEQDPVVQRAWEKWDIRKVLDSRWTAIGPRLRGKLHVFVGDMDSFRLDESVALLCEFLASKRSDATCETVTGKNHFNLLGDPADKGSLVWRIEHEMAEEATR